MNVVLISLDCVRSDALRCNGNRWAFTPTLDGLARQGVSYPNCFVQAPFTPASHASILTGLNPPGHGIRTMTGHQLRAGTPTLAQHLRQAGYQTGAFVSALALGRWYGMDAGFDVYDDVFRRRIDFGFWGAARPGDETVRSACDWLARVRSPAFLFVHFFDVHDEPGKRHNRLKAAWRLARVDGYVARMLEALEARGMRSNTLVVVTSDHGDAFGEHGERTHRDFVFDSTLRVPLILSWPGAPHGRTDPTLARSIDIVPTVLDILGLDGPYPGPDGRSLLRPPANEPLAYAETVIGRMRGTGADNREDVSDVRRSYAAIRSERWKLIWDRLTDGYALYDVARDPGESENVIERHPAEAETLKRALAAAHAPMEPRVEEVDAERERILRSMQSLGYVE